MTAVIAHRGASAVERENTLAAFRRARQLGADAVELDVRTTADGILVVHHDAWIADPEGRAIVELPRSALPTHVPTLEAALDACEGMWVNVEIKNDPADPDFDPNDRIADAVVEALGLRCQPERWLISSFRMETIDRCRALEASIATAWLTVEVTPDMADRLHRHGHRALHPWFAAVDDALIGSCHDLGVAVNVWTCDDPDTCANWRPGASTGSARMCPIPR